MPKPYSRGLRTYATASDWSGYEQSARQLAASMLVEDVSGITSVNDVHARKGILHWDFNSGADNSWGESSTVWTQNTSSSTSQGDEVEVYQLDSNNRMQDKTAVVYGIQHLAGGSLTDDISQIVFKNRTGGTIERIDVSQLDVAADDDYRALLENPIALRANKTLNIEFEAQSDLSSNDPEVMFHTTVADQAGQDLEQSDRFVEDQN